VQVILKSLLVGILCTLPFAPGVATVEVPENLSVSAKQSEVSRKVSDIIARFHYSRQRIDNSLSSAILDRYLDTLDGNRMYFLAADVSQFSRYRYELDERVRSGELQPIFDVFNDYRRRTTERVDFALGMLANEPTFTTDEDYQFDRSELAWPITTEELDEVWRKRVKNDGLSLMLTGKTWEESAEILEKRYTRMQKRVLQITGDDVFETFMNSYAHTLDPHSSYLSPRHSEEYRIQMSLSYDGIGASLQLEDDYVTVMDVIVGGPAHLDGQLKKQDRIVAVGQGPETELIDVIGWRLDDVVQLIRGPSGSPVRLQVLPEAALPGAGEKVVTLVRDKVKLEAQAAQKDIIALPGETSERKIGVITVPSFYQDYAARSRGEEDYTSTTGDVRRLVEELEAEDVDGLVLDLRGNGGGHLSEATDLSGLFIKSGPVVQLKETHGRVQVLDDPSPNAVYDGPLVVLVDRFSASASEIFAAAIQDYERGVVIGQQTFGKGSVQNLFNLDRYMQGEGFGQLTLTIGKYYRVTGGSTQHRGVMPDIQLPSAVDVETIGESSRDTALPWDQIAPTGYRVGSSLDDEIVLLSRNHEARALEDPNFNFLLDEFRYFKSLRGRKAFSLNRETREAERKEQLAKQLDRENRRRAALGLEPIESNDALEELDRRDVILDQAAQVVADMASLEVPGQHIPRGQETRAQAN
jgi:carboxyl-terminal processing protease